MKALISVAALAAIVGTASLAQTAEQSVYLQSIDKGDPWSAAEIAGRTAAIDDQATAQSPWLITLAKLKPLSIEEREFVLDVLGIEMDQQVLDQAIEEN
jgi:hypothetical protein